MPTEYTVRKGDCISSIAEKFGFFEDTIWSDAANAQVRECRSDANILQPGDVITIPDKTLKQESAATGERHRFLRKGVPVTLDIELYDEDEPRANLPFTLVVDGHYIDGVTDAEGKIHVAIPPSARSAEIRFENDATIELELGNMNPDDVVDGMQARLENLGFYGGDHDSDAGPMTADAIRDFQRHYELEETGELDSATVAKIKEEHGS